MSKLLTGEEPQIKIADLFLPAELWKKMTNRSVLATYVLPAPQLQLS